MSHRVTVLGLAVLLAFVALPAFAAAGRVRITQDCPERRNFYGKHPENRVAMIPLSRDCSVNVYPRGAEGVSEALNRDYMFTSEGQFMVFNFYGFEGNLSDNLGVRSYFLVPRRVAVDYELNEAGDLAAQLASGEMASFDSATGELASVSGLRIKVSPKIYEDNKGGVEILASDKSLVIDAGWRIGGAPESVANGNSTVIDTHGKRCVVKNQKLFMRIDPYDDEEVELLSDKKLWALLVKSCPKLDLSPLKN